MSDFNYTLTLADIGTKHVDLVGDTIKCVLCTSAYTANQDTDHFLSDIPSGARLATVTLSGKSFTGAIFDADDVTFPAVAGGSTATQAVIYQDGSPEGTARLIRRVSNPNYAAFPFATNGADINFAFPNDAKKIFSLVNV